MQVRNTTRRWGVPAIGLHWLVALLVIGMLIVGFSMVRFYEDDLARKFELYQLHKSFGFTVFCLAALRLGWRALNPTPALPDTLKPYERVLARVTHWGLYVLLAALPISGWLMSSASPLGITTRVFDLFALPNAVSPDQALFDLLHEVHEILAFVLAGLLVLHVAAAFKHHFVLKDDTLKRMLPGRSA